MNANALHPGHDYAFVTFVRRNRRYRPEAKRVRVLHVYKLDDPYSTKKKTFVEVVPLTDEGERVTDHSGVELPVKTIKAPQLYTTWAEHVIERDKYMKETAERNTIYERQQREQEERAAIQQREYEERMSRERVENERKKERILSMLEEAGIERDLVRISSYEIRIDRSQLERRLNGKQGVESRTGSEPVSYSNR